MGNYFTSNKVNANQHLINTDNKITILVDITSIDVPVSQTDKTDIIVGGEADAKVTEPEIIDVVENKSELGEVAEPEAGGEVAEPEVDVSSKSESSKDVGDLEQQGGDSELSVENNTRINKPKNRRKNKRPKN